MFNCPHTGVALAALEKIVARGEIKRSDRVIVISTANGLKFSEFKTAYHTGSLAGVTPRHANPPVELPNDYDAVRRAIESVAAGIADRGPSSGREVRSRARRSKSGSSAAHRSPTSSAIAKAVAPHRAAQGPLVIVASALAGVTDLLLEGAAAATPGGSRCRQVRGRSSSAATATWRAASCRPGPARRRLLAAIDAAAREYRELCVAIGVLGHLAPRASDLLVSRGERMSAQIVAAALSRGAPARGVRRCGRRRRHRRPSRRRRAATSPATARLARKRDASRSSAPARRR